MFFLLDERFIVLYWFQFVERKYFSLIPSFGKDKSVNEIFPSLSCYHFWHCLTKFCLENIGLEFSKDIFFRVISPTAQNQNTRLIIRSYMMTLCKIEACVGIKYKFCMNIFYVMQYLLGNYNICLWHRSLNSM